MLRKYLTFLLASALLLQACKDDAVDPVLTLTAAHQITVPTEASAYILSAATANDVFETITWTAAQYSLSNVGKVFYTLQMDAKGNGFADALTLATTNDLNKAITVKEMNDKLLLLGYAPDVAVEMEFRVAASVEQKSDPVYSNVVGVSITPYGATVNVKPIYMLGSGSAAGWDNTLALPMTYLDGGRYEIVATLTAGTDQFVKFISNLGAWAPQWGTDGTGTSTGGPLVYRPDEVTADPPAIPTPAVTSQYKVIVDTALLTYEIFEYGDIYVLGDATDAGWDNTLALPMVKVSEGKYYIITNLAGAGKNWKIIDERGAWAPQWGSDGTGTADAGTLAYRPTEAEPDPAAIPAPDAAGLYKIEVDIVNLTYTVTLQ